MVKNLPANAADAGDTGSILGQEEPLKEMASCPAFLPGKFHGQRSLVGYISWGLKELNTTKYKSPVVSDTRYPKFFLIVCRVRVNVPE